MEARHVELVDRLFGGRSFAADEFVRVHGCISQLPPSKRRTLIRRLSHEKSYLIPTQRKLVNEILDELREVTPV